MGMLFSANKLKVGLLAVALYGTSAPAGINWKAVWLEKPYNPVFLDPGAVQKYEVKGLNGADVTADLTGSEYLKVVSLNPNVVEVDQANAQLIGKSEGQTELRILLSEATSIVRVFVRRPKRN
jgi:hypothetical protein